MGDSHVIGSGDDHIPYAESAGEQNGPDGVQHPQVADQQIGGNQAAAEKHGDDKHDIEEAFPSEIRPGHGVGRQQRYRNGNDGKEYGINQCVLKAGPDLGVGHDPLIGGQGPFAEIEGQSAVLQGDGVNKGGQDDIDHRQDDGGHKQSQDRIGKNHDRLVALGELGECCFHCASPFLRCPCRH